jgi:hypothetical protein
MLNQQKEIEYLSPSTNHYMETCQASNFIGILMKTRFPYIHYNIVTLNLLFIHFWICQYISYILIFINQSY